VFFRVLKHCSASTTSGSNSSSTTTDSAAAAAGMNGSAAQLDSSSSSSSKGVLTQPWPAAKVHRKFPLLQPTLTGLGRYSHLISVDYFNDLMAVLQEVRRHRACI
jgi:nucleolar complex protein 3